MSLLALLFVNFIKKHTTGAWGCWVGAAIHTKKIKGKLWLLRRSRFKETHGMYRVSAGISQIALTFQFFQITATALWSTKFNA